MPAPIEKRTSKAWNRRIAGLFLLSILIAATGITISFLTNGRPQFKRYVSPAVDARGTRVEFSYPEGFALLGFTDREKARNRVRSTGASFMLANTDPLGWMPGWLRNWFKKPDKSNMYVWVGPLFAPRKPWLYDGRMHFTTMPVRGGGRVSVAERGLLSKDGRYWLHVEYTEDGPTSSKARAVCESLRFVALPTEDVTAR